MNLKLTLSKNRTIFLVFVKISRILQKIIFAFFRTKKYFTISRLYFRNNSQKDVENSKIAIEISGLCGSSAHSGIGKYINNLLLHLNDSQSLNDQNKFIFLTISCNQVMIFNFKDLKFEVNEVLPFKEGPEKILSELGLVSLLWTSPFEETIKKLSIPNLRCFAIIYDLIPLGNPWDFKSKASRKTFINKFKELNTIGLFPISQHTAKDIVKYVKSPQIIHVIGAGNFGSAYLDFSTMSANNTLSGINKNFILVPGGENPRKNLDLVVKAWSKSIFAQKSNLLITNNLREGTRARLRIVAGQYAKNLIFVGHVSELELRFIYSKALAVICPSYTEGMGLPAIEASEFSSTVIASDIPSHREFSSENVVFFRNNNWRSLRFFINNIKDNNFTKPKGSKLTWNQVSKNFIQELIEQSF